MTVAELIEKLQALTDEQKKYIMYSEGCDCVAEAVDIKVELASAHLPATVTICRK